MGKELGITYEEVKAYQASQGINTYAADSNGGYTTGGVYVEWEVTSGFTGQGWDETNNESPYNWVTREEWNQDIADGDLNDTFRKWTSPVEQGGLDFESRYAWVGTMIARGCAYEQQ
ncbi:MAG TPA: hypothetical protein IAB53_11125 [Candidatus Scybalocola faecipullorum]|nr:hypothetical protein [Candidatus Scybalocola faecipullorum]